MLWKLRGPLPVLVAVSAFAGGATPAFAAADARDAARAYLEANAAKFGVSSADLSDMTFTSVYETKGLGVTHVNMNQRFRDLEVFGGHVTVNVDSAGKVIFAGGAAVSLAKVASDEQTIDATTAVNKAAIGLKLEQPTKLRVTRRSGTKSQSTTMSGGGISHEPIKADLGWQPTAQGLKLAWRMQIDDTSASHLWNAAVDAKTGALLKKDDWTSHDQLDELKTPARRAAAQAVQGLPALRVADAHTVSGARRLGLPRVRVAEREPERRRSHARGQPGRLRWFAVRLA